MSNLQGPQQFHAISSAELGSPCDFEDSFSPAWSVPHLSDVPSDTINFELSNCLSPLSNDRPFGDVPSRDYPETLLAVGPMVITESTCAIFDDQIKTQEFWSASNPPFLDHICLDPYADECETSLLGQVESSTPESEQFEPTNPGKVTGCQSRLFQFTQTDLD